MPADYMMGCHVSGQLSEELNAALPTHVCYGFDGHEYILTSKTDVALIQNYITRHRTDITLRRRCSIESDVVFDVTDNNAL